MKDDIAVSWQPCITPPLIAAAVQATPASVSSQPA